MLYMSSNIAKKINKIIATKNNTELQTDQLTALNKKIVLQKERKKACYERKTKCREKAINETNERKNQTAEKLESIKNTIWNNVNKKRIKTQYTKLSKKMR